MALMAWPLRPLLKERFPAVFFQAKASRVQRQPASAPGFRLGWLCCGIAQHLLLRTLDELLLGAAFRLLALLFQSLHFPLALSESDAHGSPRKDPD